MCTAFSKLHCDDIHHILCMTLAAGALMLASRLAANLASLAGLDLHKSSEAAEEDAFMPAAHKLFTFAPPHILLTLCPTPSPPYVSSCEISSPGCCWAMGAAANLGLSCQRHDHQAIVVLS